jgi:tryptophan synthase beta subunit
LAVRGGRRGELPRGARVIVNVSGRGDKDLATWMKVGAQVPADRTVTTNGRMNLERRP